MPWQSDRGLTGSEPYWAEHHRVIPEQTNEWKTLRERYGDGALCTARDFNMNLGGATPTARSKVGDRLRRAVG